MPRRTLLTERRGPGSGSALGLTALGLAGPLIAFSCLWAASRQASPTAAVVACAIMPALIIALVRPDLSTAAVGVLVMANAGLVLGDGYGIPNVTHAALLVAVAAVLIHRGTRDAATRANPVYYAFLIYGGVRLWSGLATPEALTASDIVQELAFGGAILFVLAAAGGSAPTLRGVVTAIVGCAGALSILIQLKLVGIGGTWWGFAGDIGLTGSRAEAALRSLEAPSQEGRAAGPVGDPNFWAQALIIALPLGVWLVRSAPTRGQRVMAAVACALIGLALLETGSRGGLFALLIAFGVMLWAEGGRARRSIWVLPLAFLVVLIASGSASRFEQLAGVLDPYGAEDVSVQGRYSENLAALQMLAAHPLTGVGAGNFPLEYPAYATRIGLDPKHEQRRAHNSYLEAGAESGLPGLLAFGALFLTAGAAVTRARRRLIARGQRDAAGFAGAVGVALVGYAISAIFLHQGYPDYLWLLLGLACAAWVLSGAATTPRWEAA
jgi:hypothetical protein